MDLYIILYISIAEVEGLLLIISRTNSICLLHFYTWAPSVFVTAILFEDIYVNS